MKARQRQAVFLQCSSTGPELLSLERTFPMAIFLSESSTHTFNSQSLRGLLQTLATNVFQSVGVASVQSHPVDVATICVTFRVGHLSLEIQNHECRRTSRQREDLLLQFLLPQPLWAVSSSPSPCESRMRSTRVRFLFHIHWCTRPAAQSGSARMHAIHLYSCERGSETPWF